MGFSGRRRSEAPVARPTTWRPEVGGDGFMISAPISRRTIAEITDALVPALQAQGLVRSAYPSKDLRDTLFEFR